MSGKAASGRSRPRSGLADPDGSARTETVPDDTPATEPLTQKTTASQGDGGREDTPQSAGLPRARRPLPPQPTGRTSATPDDSLPRPVPGATFEELSIAEIHPNAKQPRQVFDEDALHELTHSIREFGVLQPVVVRADPTGGYELVMGERRLRAAERGGSRGDPGHRAHDRRRRHAARRAAREHPSGAAQPAGGGCGVSAAARGVRHDA